MTIVEKPSSTPAVLYLYKRVPALLATNKPPEIWTDGQGEPHLHMDATDIIVHTRLLNSTGTEGREFSWNYEYPSSLLKSQLPMMQHSTESGQRKDQK